ncbi:hypothetical protein SC657_08615 [Legionella pneumophila]
MTNGIDPKAPEINLFSDIEQEFFFWVDPKNAIIFNNICNSGCVSSNPENSSNNPEENLLFVPNPKYKGFITPYQNNIVKRIRAEYWLETFRPSNYPSRLQALYLFISEQDAMEYNKIHMSHTKDRELIKGISSKSCLYSIHDSGWFDFLCKDVSLDEETARNSAIQYWSGMKICDSQVYLYGNSWSQTPTMEVLFYGILNISEPDKEKISQLFKQAYKKNPSNYPTMSLESSTSQELGNRGMKTKINGWQRLWITIVILYLLFIVFITWTTFPTELQTEYACNDPRNPLYGNPFCAVEVHDNRIQEQKDILRKEQINTLGYAFLMWILPLVLLYIIGLLIHWTYEGFKKR